MKITYSGEGNTFSRIEYFLLDYIGIQQDCVDPNDAEWTAPILEIIKEVEALVESIRELQGSFTDRKQFGDAKSAALIVADMLKDWSFPGSVWFLPTARRFRLSAEGHEPVKNEVCVGVYLPDAPVEMLEEDFKAVLNE